MLQLVAGEPVAHLDVVQRLIQRVEHGEHGERDHGVPGEVVVGVEEPPADGGRDEADQHAQQCRRDDPGVQALPGDVGLGLLRRLAIRAVGLRTGWCSTGTDRLAVLLLLRRRQTHVASPRVSATASVS